MKLHKIKVTEDKICAVCMRQIDNDADYYLINFYKSGVFVGKAFYHWRCHNNRLNREEIIKQEAQSDGSN